MVCTTKQIGDENMNKSKKKKIKKKVKSSF